MHRILTLLLSAFSLLLVSCGKDGVKHKIDRSTVNMEFNATHNTERFEEFCREILPCEELYSSDFFRFKVDQDSENFILRISNKKDGTHFEKTGLIENDIVVQLNNIPINEPKNMRDIYTAFKENLLLDNILKLIVLRGDTEVLIEIPVSKQACPIETTIDIKPCLNNNQDRINSCID